VGLLFVQGNAVVLGDLTVNTEHHRLLLHRDMRQPNLALDRLHPHPGNVSYIGHQYLLLLSSRCVYQS
jgi:hypothetical protein